MPSPSVHDAFPPLCGDTARILILGTFPSPLSRDKGEYYGNPRNQFWRIVFGVYGEPFEAPDYLLKQKLLTKNGIALWDVIVACEAEGSSDSDLRNLEYNTKLPTFIEQNAIQNVFFNGNNAYKFYLRGIGSIEKNVLPSTSPANASMRFDEKLRLWRDALLR